jgi:hypothetical protein
MSGIYLDDWETDIMIEIIKIEKKLLVYKTALQYLTDEPKSAATQGSLLGIIAHVTAQEKIKNVQ